MMWSYQISVEDRRQLGGNPDLAVLKPCRHPGEVLAGAGACEAVARADVEMRRVRVTDDVAAVAGEEPVLPVLHRPVLVRTVVKPDEHFVALSHDAELVV